MLYAKNPAKSIFVKNAKTGESYAKDHVVGDDCRYEE